MRKELLLLALILSSNFILGQNYCAATTNSSVKNYTSLSRMLYANSSNEETLCLNVYFHIVREDNGSGGIPAYQTSVIINELNSNFSNYNIAFNKIGQDFINNSEYNDIDPAEIPSLIAINNTPNAINFYIVENATFNGWAEILGTNLILTDSAAITNVSSHEMGHCLNLYHTHEANKFGVEIAEKCSSTGDLICDTPPDPNLRNPDGSYKVDNNCLYTLNDGY